MGLAASQARLLTITARLADNELRSQTINNAKMRLATQSAQASDEYVSALNNAQMMFSNTTPDGLTQSQALSFNALTQYSPYNTQYGIVNTAGQIMVSEEDAKIFESCNNNLETFLKAHNLEWETTFFDESSGDLQAKLTSFYGTGDKEIGYLFEGKSNSDLKNIYLDSLSQESSIEKLNYSIVAKQYHNAIVNLHKLVEGEFQELLFGKDPQNKITEIKNNSKSKSLTEVASDLLNNTQYGLIPLHQKGFITEDAYTKWMHTINSLHYYKIGTQDIAGCASGDEKSLDSFPMDLDYGVKITCIAGVYTISNTGTEATMYSDGVKKSSVIGTNIESMLNKITIEHSDNNNPSYGYYAEDGKYYQVKLKYNYNKDDNSYSYIDKNTVVENFVGEYLNALNKEGTFNAFKYIQSQEGNASASAALKEFENLRINYERYGLNLKIPDESGLLVDFDRYVKEYDHTKVLALANTNQAYKSVLNSYMAEKMLDVLGEPKYAWVDASDSTNTGNAEAKAKWLTNLFNRMQKGYKVLENGLAKSTQWLEYALESGLVTMEQVDLSQNWNALDYKSCANIFEQTDNSAAVARAEAKYNRAMNDIKQKDSMYDLQLKNIDTEHNALQTEYDVIKDVIKKNIERTMKFNQSA